MKKACGTLILILGMALPAFASSMKIAVPILSGHFDQNGQGRSAGALRTIFSQCGITPEFKLFRWGQHWLSYEQDPDIDAVAIVWKNAGVAGFISKPFIHQKNGVAFLASAKLRIKTLEDLKGLRVLGFGGATEMFPGLAAIVPKLKSYWEAPAGFSTTQALLRGDVDVFITDGLIFAIDYKERAEKTGGTYGDANWPKVKFVGLFPENGDEVTFRRESDRDAFDRCRAQAASSGAIAKATAPYIAPYKDIVGDQIPPQ